MSNFRLLIVKDRAADAELMVEELQSAGLDPTWERVDTEQDYLARLTPELDLILSDYNLPQFDGLCALSLLKERGLDVPFILLSGALGEDIAVRAMRSGATDYLLKTHLSRLGQAVIAALEQKRLRHEKQRLDKELLKTQQHFRALIEHSSDAIVLLDADGKFAYVSPSLERILGVGADDIIGRSPAEFTHPDDLPSLSSWLVQVFHTPGKSITVQYRFRHVDGSWRWLDSTITNLMAEPTVGAVVLNCRDITDRKDAQDKALQLAAIVESSGEAIISQTLDGTILTWNAAATAQYGYTAAEVIGRSVVTFIPPDRRAQEHENFERFKHSEASQHFETLRVRQDGSVFPVAVTISPIRDVDGRLVGAARLSRDLTEHQRAERALYQVAENKTRRNSAVAAGDILVVFMLTIAVYALIAFTRSLDPILDPLIEPLLVSSLGTFARDADEFLITSLVLGVALLFFAQRRSKPLKAQVVARQNAEAALRDLHGELEQRVRERTTELVNANTALQTEIGERRRAAAALAASEIKFRALIDKSADAIVLIDAEGTVLYASSTITRILGGEPGYWLGGNWLNRAHAEDLPTVSNLFAQVLQAPGESVTTEFRYQHIDGTWLWLEATGTNLLAEPSVHAIVGNIRDITERKHAEQSLQESEQRFRQLFESSPDAILLIDPTDKESKWFIVDCNAIAGHMNGYTRDELIGQSIDLLNQNPATPPERSAYLQSVRQNGVLRVQSLHRHKDGHLIPIETSTSLITVGGRELVLGIDRDVSERKHSEAEIAQRVAQLSTLNGIGQVISTLQNIDELLEVIYREVSRSFPLDFFYVGLYDSETTEFTYRLMYDDGIRFQEPAGILSQDSYLGQVLCTAVPMLVNRSAAELRTQSTEGRLANVAKPSASLMFTPLQIGPRIIGAMSAQSYTLNAYTEEDLTLLAGITNQAAIAIENARLFEVTKQQVHFLSALRTIDMAISGSVDIGLTFEILLDQVVNQLKVDASCVLLLNPDTYTLHFGAGRGFRTRGIEQARLRLGEGFAGRAALERRVVAAHDLATSSPDPVWRKFLSDENFATYYGVPLITKGRVTGVLEIFNRKPLTSTPEWLKFLEALAGQAAIAIDGANLFEKLQRSNLELALAYDATIEGWSRALDLRDKETEGQSQRITEVTVALAHRMGVRDQDLVQIRRGALLHDIGKMGIPDVILLKPGPLTAEEWAVMRLHPVYAYDLLGKVAYLRAALDIPHCHHEKWDGSGYPRGLRGLEIPLSARIFAVVDVWDALRSDRPYRKAWEEPAIREYIANEAGKHFDPAVVTAFLAMLGP